MKEKFLIVLVLIASVMAERFNVNAQDAASKAQQLLAQARVAIGGDKMKDVQSLSVEGSYRRSFGNGMEMSGEVIFEMLGTDKMLRTETMNPMPGIEITRIEALNGDKVWEDQQQGGGGGGMVMIRRGGPKNDPKQAEDGIRIELNRWALGLLLTTSTSYPVTFTYAGEAESPEGKADVLDAKVPTGPALRLYLDQKSHRLLMMTYKSKRPRMVMHSASSGPPSEADLQKQIKEAEAEAAKQPDVEYQIRYSDYRPVNGISIPHKITRGIESETNEEMTVAKVKINPSLKPEKFVKR